MKERELIKKAIFQIWKKSGLTKENILGIIHSDSMKKQAFLEVMFKDIPMIAFGIPFVGGALAYTLSHPNEIKKQMFKKTKKMLEEANIELDTSKGITLG